MRLLIALANSANYAFAGQPGAYLVTMHSYRGPAETLLCRLTYGPVH